MKRQVAWTIFILACVGAGAVGYANSHNPYEAASRQAKAETDRQLFPRYRCYADTITVELMPGQVLIVRGAIR